MIRFLTLNRIVLFFILTIPWAVIYFYPFESYRSFAIWNFLAFTIVFIWLLLLDTAITQRVLPRIRPSNKFFRVNLTIVYLVSGLGPLYFLVGDTFRFVGLKAVLSLIPVLYLCYAFFAIFSHLSKVLTYAEKQDPVKLTSRLGELFSFMFFFIGIWWLQPRIKKVLDKQVIPVQKYVPFRS